MTVSFLMTAVNKERSLSNAAWSNLQIVENTIRLDFRLIYYTYHILFCHL